MAQKPPYIPKFGDWDPNDRMPYTAVFDQVRAGKGKTINPNDPAEVLNGNSSQEGNSFGKAEHSNGKAGSQHRRGTSKDDAEFKFGNHAANGRHTRRHSRGEEFSPSHLANRNLERASWDRSGSGASPINPQAYPGRVGGRFGSASPVVDKKLESAAAPGTPNRNRTERYAAQLPKFGDWDVNNPASGDGFTMIFEKARDEKKTGGPLRVPESPLRPEIIESQKSQSTHGEGPKWFCCCFQPNTAA